MMQYADDSRIPLQPKSTPLLEKVMALFGPTTIQRLNTAKSHIGPVGGSFACNTLRISSTIPVVSQAKILGLPLNLDGSTTVDWKDKLKKYERKVNYIRSRWIPVPSKVYQISSPHKHGWSNSGKLQDKLSHTRRRLTLYAAKLKDRGTGCLHFTNTGV